MEDGTIVVLACLAVIALSEVRCYLLRKAFREAFEAYRDLWERHTGKSWDDLPAPPQEMRGAQIPENERLRVVPDEDKDQ